MTRINVFINYQNIWLLQSTPAEHPQGTESAGKEIVLKWVYHTDLNINIKSTVMQVEYTHTHTLTHTHTPWQEGTSYSLWNIQGFIFKMQHIYIIFFFLSPTLLWYGILPWQYACRVRRCCDKFKRSDCVGTFMYACLLEFPCFSLYLYFDSR